ncbi:hypothetical protein GQ43DRAFT_443542 [Delitschia confertaspora ATCC 74209]|uniref:Mediator of RNA polymerase II transcription subunit 16 n=1 Tax=Delitschia confertaspora ATCC 74209 TaxID=1513339 RepID=A0A9P4JF21_9PLEO|nr:hypothetical protein GQ43DRAFT_443542 [Delitschia confertaspora ATCC 74209]
MDDAYNMDVDDLFGDSEEVTIPLISSPPIKGLVRRLDELQTSGCCQKIAWSNSGCIAYITPDGHGVNLKAFMRNPATDKWEFGKDTSLTLPHSQHDFPIVHLSWSHLGTDLAVINSAGRLIMFTAAFALDRMILARQHFVDQEDEMGAVVGLHWLSILPHEKQNNIAWFASGKDTKWNFQMGRHTFEDTCHPIEGRASLIEVGRNGQVKLRFQQHDSNWHEVSTELEYMSSARETLTHAAFASNSDKTLLLATYDVCSKIHLYRIKIDWKMTEQKNSQPPPPRPFPTPVLEVDLLTHREHCYPLGPTTGDLTGSAGTKPPVHSRLTHFNFLPRTPEQNVETVPTLQAIFCSPPNILSLDQTQPQNSPYSVVLRWEFEEKHQNHLHPSLDKVTSKKTSLDRVNPRASHSLRRLPVQSMHSIVLSFFPFWYNMVLAFCYSDGTIEFRNRITMEVMGPNYNAETVTSLSQAGFAFSALEPCLQVSFSPNHCMAAGLQHDGTIKLKAMEYTHGSLNSEEDDPKHAAAVAALALQSTTATNMYLTTDDIFAVIGEISDTRKEHFITHLLQALHISLDYALEDKHNKYAMMLIGRSTPLTKTLSAAHLIGLQGTMTRSISSNVCWILINLKYATQAFTGVARMHNDLTKNPLRPEMVPQLVGICRWAMHFMIFIVDELLTLGREMGAMRDDNAQPPTPPFTRANLEQKIKDLDNPAISILLSSAARALIKWWVQPLTWIVRSVQSHTGPSAPADRRLIYSELSHALSDIPFQWTYFTQLVLEVQDLVRTAYREKNYNETQRNHVERELLMGKIPDIMVPVAKTVLYEKMYGNKAPVGDGSGRMRRQGGLLHKIDAPAVIYFDTTWLGLTNSQHARRWFTAHVVDVCQKMIVRGSGTQTHWSFGQGAPGGNGANGIPVGGNAGLEDGGKRKRTRLRQCTRCGCFMEDVMPGTPGFSSQHVNWLLNMAKRCVCDSNWMLATEREDLWG